MRNNGNMAVGFVNRRHTCINANTINVTRITNVTHVTHVTHVSKSSHYKSHSGWKHDNRWHKKSHCRAERPPKLTRFCASFGLLDRNVAARMSDGQLRYETAKVTAYAARGLVRNTGKCFGSAAKCVGGFAKSIGMVFGSFFRAFK